MAAEHDARFLTNLGNGFARHIHYAIFGLTGKQVAALPGQGLQIFQIGFNLRGYVGREIAMVFGIPGNKRSVLKINILPFQIADVLIPSIQYAAAATNTPWLFRCSVLKRPDTNP